MLIKMKLPERKEHRPSCVALRQLQMCDCGIQYWNDYRDQIESLNQPLVRGMEIDVEALENIIINFAFKMRHEELHFKDMAADIKANAHVWLKEVEKGK